MAGDYLLEEEVWAEVLVVLEGNADWGVVVEEVMLEIGIGTGLRVEDYDAQIGCEIQLVEFD